MQKPNLLILSTGYISDNFVRKYHRNYNIHISSRKKLSKFHKNFKCNYVGDFFDKPLTILKNRNFEKVLIFSSNFSSSSNDQIELKEYLKKFKMIVSLVGDIKTVKKLIYLSSSSLYGLTEKKRLFTEKNKIFVDSNYRKEKFFSETIVLETLKSSQIDFNILRVSNPYGTNHLIPSEGFINIAMKNIYARKRTYISGDGSEVRDFIYIDDLVDLINICLEKKLKEKVFNVGSGKGIRLEEVVKKIILLKKDFDFEYQNQKVKNKSSILDTSLFLRDMGSFNLTSLEEGLKKFIKFIEMDKAV
tara:strand:+ start:585 stop:1493 length:909 start_codon:yes stop_codon:yes gene_type:complete